MVTQQDLEQLGLTALPADAASLLAALQAPPRLIAHLTLVHDVALRIVRVVEKRWPQVQFDRGDVLFGAATHDIGKAIHREELSGPGARHEEDGRRALEERGVDAARARFAATHARWSSASPLEDLFVSLADKCWKGKRTKDLEELVVARIVAATGAATWDVFVKLDDALTTIAADADERLAWQARFAL